MTTVEQQQSLPLALPAHLAERAALIKSQITSQLPRHTILYRNVSHPLDSTTLIPYSALLKPRQLEILDLDAVALVQALGERRYSAAEVVGAYMISASIAQQATGCLTWYDHVSAMRQAEELDRKLEETGRVVGPLHGVVISIKQLVQVKGWPQNASHFNFEEFIPEEDALLVKILREAGAVFMVKTTQPQSIMQLETQSWNYGKTSCAHNRNCTSGGSSGGEGALVAMKGSTIGVGTDIGGSIRNPAAFNGLWGFKSSSKRLPRDGVLGGLWGGTHHARIRGCIGPLTRSLRDMELFMRVIIASECWRDDSSLLPLPWRSVTPEGEGLGYKGWSGAGTGTGEEKDTKRRMRVGVIWDDGNVRPVSCIQRGMEHVVGRLKEAGMEVVDVQPRDFKESWEIITALYYIDGGKKLREILGDEPLLPLTEWILSHSKELSSFEIDTLVARRESLRQQHLTHFRSLNLDVLLLPAGPAPAQLHGTTKYWSYTSMFNLLDWPAAVFPTGLFVYPKLDGEGHDPRTPENEHEKHLYENFSAETSVGVPIGLQLVAPRFEDESLMEALKLVDSALA